MVLCSISMYTTEYYDVNYIYNIGLSTVIVFFFFQAEDGIRDLVRSRGLGDVYKRQPRGSAPFEGGWGMTMKAIIQRVKKATVSIEEKTHSSIQHGLLILLGIEESDTQEDITWLSKKIAQLRIFSDENDLMNLSVIDVKGEILVVSQFTLFASTKKGNRPSFIRRAKPDSTIPMHEIFI